MSRHIVSSENLEMALDYLRDNAVALGAAKERLVMAEHMVKVTEAIEFKKSDAKSAEARKEDARSSKAYHEAIVEEAKAAGAYEEMRSRAKAAEMKIEAWRSEQANWRAMKL